MTAAWASDDMTTDEPDATISATVRALAGARRADTAEIARAIGISRNSYYNRINGEKPWHARDVARAAAYFGVPIADLYAGRVTIPFRNSAPHTRGSQSPAANMSHSSPVSFIHVTPSEQVSASGQARARVPFTGPNANSEWRTPSQMVA